MNSGTHRSMLRYMARSVRVIALSVLLQIAAVILLTGCTATRTFDEMPLERETIEAKGRYLKQYLLMEGDRIEISVWQVPEVSRVVEIRPDGKISLPTVSSVQAAGLTFEELEAVLSEKLAERIRDPLVTVIAVDIRDASVFVLGDVNAQRAVPIRQASTALEAIAMAGGLIRTSAADEISIIRLGDDGILRAIPVNVPLEGQPASYMSLTATLLQPDDIVFVPESSRSGYTRWMDDFIGRPLTYITSALVSYRIITNPVF